MYTLRQGAFAFLMFSIIAVVSFSIALLIGPSSARAELVKSPASNSSSVFQFNVGDAGYLRALSVAAAHEALAETDVEEKINLDENYQPEDFGIENLGFLPNNPFYVLKSLRRGFTSALTFDPAAQAELKLQFAAEKLLEAKELAGREGIGEDAIVRALGNYNEELARVDKEIREAAGVPEERRAELLENSLDAMTKYQKVLGTFDKVLSSENFDAIQGVRDGTAETFSAAFALGAPEDVSEKLVQVFDTQSGSEFKHFKNAEVLKYIADRAPLEARDAIENAEENVLAKLQVQLEQSDSAQKATFTDFVKEMGGNEVRHLEIINDIESRPISDDVREAIADVKEEVWAKTENHLAELLPEQKEKFLGHLTEGTLENVRTIKEIENNVAEGVLVGVEKVREQATEDLKQKLESANDVEKQEFTTSIERFHDAKSIAVLEEISALIPDDKKEFFNSLKTKAAQEIKRDIDNARNASQRQIIYKALAGDHPEQVAALDSFGKDAAVSSAVRGVLEGLRSAQYGRVQNRAENIKDEGRLAKFEGDYEKYQTHFEEVPGGFNIRVVFEDKRGIFESPERAEEKIAEARNMLAKLEAAISTLPFEVGFEDGHFDPAIQEIERMRAAAERKLGVAETSLEYGDEGRAYGEAQASLQMAKNGLNMAGGYKSGRKQEKQVPDFLPEDFYTRAPEDRGSLATGFNVYNTSEFSQFCAFVGGFLKGKVRCEFSDGRSLEVPGGRFPFRIPPEFTPKKVDEPIGEDGKKTPVGCPPLPAIYGDFCATGKMVYQYDARGCPLSPRCEYERPRGGEQCRGYISESSCRTSGCVWYQDLNGGYCDDEAHGRVNKPDPFPEYRVHPTDPSLCGGREGYQCREGSYCQYPVSDSGTAVGGYGKCVKGTDEKTCQANFIGWVNEPNATKSGTQCVERSATGCTSPFVYKTKEQCESGQRTDVDPYKGDANSCPGFAYSRWDAKSVRYCQLNYERRCDYQYPSYLTNGANYKAENCPVDSTTTCSSVTSESTCVATKGCAWGISSGESIKRCYDGGGRTNVCPSMPTVSTCPAGQKRVLSYSTPECGEYYTCTGDTGTKAGWLSHIWKFTDGEQSSMILDRTDSEYTGFIASIDAQCVKISKSKFAWKSGAGDDRADNWQNFGIPDCSGTASAAQCGNNMCEMGETVQSCPSDCGSTGGTPQCSDGKDNDSDGKTDYPDDTGCYGRDDWDETYGSTTGGDKCSGYSSETSCKAVSDCGWTIMSSMSQGGYCSLTSTMWTPQCGDGKDNDGDGKVDYPNDSGCYGKTDDMEQDNVGGEAGMRKCFYNNATINGTYPGYSVWCEADYVNCHKGSQSGEAISTSGLSLGAPSQCESGWTGGSGSGGGCGMYTSQSSCSGMSACQWVNNACSPSSTTSTSSSGSCGSYTTMSTCVANSACNWNSGGNYCSYNSTTSSTSQYSGESGCTSAGGTWDSVTGHCNMPSTSSSSSSSGSCGSYTSMSTCVANSACNWNSGGNYCAYNSTTSSTSCPSGQWWNGSSCVSSSTTSCSSTEYWDSATQTCKPMSSSTSSSCPSGQYWNGSSCVTSSTSSTDYSGMQSSCASAGGSWDSTSNYCVMPSTSSSSGSTSSSSSCSSTEYWTGTACAPMSSTGSGSTAGSTGGSSSCTSGQYWNGSACVATSPSDTPMP